MICLPLPLPDSLKDPAYCDTIFVSLSGGNELFEGLLWPTLGTFLTWLLCSVWFCDPGPSVTVLLKYVSWSYPFYQVLGLAGSGTICLFTTLSQHYPCTHSNPALEFYKKRFNSALVSTYNSAIGGSLSCTLSGTYLPHSLSLGDCSPDLWSTESSLLSSIS